MVTDKNHKKILFQAIILIFAILFTFYFLNFDSNSPKNTLEKAEHTNSLALDWIKNNVNKKGLFVYSFNPENDDLRTTNNELRQLMGSRILAEQAHNNKEFLKLHESNLGFIFKYWYKEDVDISYIQYDNKSKLGASAMMLRTLVHSPLYKDYENEAAKINAGILKLQNNDGSFNPWLIKPDYEYDHDYLLTFYSGEALLALTEYYEITLDEVLLNKIEKSADFYINKYVNNIEENYYPAYVPWHTMAYSHLYELTGNKKYSDAIFVMNDKLLEIQDTTDIVGRFYNPKTPEYGSPHSSSDAVYLEGLVYAYEIAKILNDIERMNRYENAINIAIENISSLQYRNVENDFKADSLKYIGAIRVNKDSNWIRVDTTQHTVDALSKVLEVF